PTEIAATLSAARLSGGHLFVIFEPHTYTRTKALYDNFVTSLLAADTSVIADIYAAREDDVYGVSSKMLAESIRERGGRSIWSGEISGGDDEFLRIVSYTAAHTGVGDTVIFIGAGDINKAVELIELKH
ncbi:MAG: UDP-N-acetylmuramate--L-alanine ligase, partial [Firmicutes bacterium]|nr:UDP-N-acetylmuramate--L-alanine ligase [Bacillota bacterium]